MNKFRVTCLLDISTGEPRRVFATRRKFATRDEAQAYADTVAEGRKPMVGYCPFATEQDGNLWIVSDGDKALVIEGDRFDELDAVEKFCEMYDRCTVSMCGVPCGSATSSPDQAGSGYDRCDGCGML